MSSTEWTRFFREAGIPNKVAMHYAKVFVDHRLVMSMLPDVTREVLRDVGIDAIGDLIAILNYAKTKIREEAMQSELLSLGTPRNLMLSGSGGVDSGDGANADLYYQADNEDDDDDSGAPTVKAMRLSRHGAYEAAGGSSSVGGVFYSHADTSSMVLDDTYATHHATSDAAAHHTTGTAVGYSPHGEGATDSYDYPGAHSTLPQMRYTTAPGRNRYARAPLPSYKSYGKVKFMESQIGHHPLAICRSDVPGHSYEFSYQKKSATKKIFRCAGCLIARKRCEFGGKVKVLQVVGDDVVNGCAHEEHHPDCMPVSNARIMVRKVRRFINSEVRDGRMEPEDAHEERAQLIDQFLAAESDQEELPTRDECDEYWPKKSALLVQLNTVKATAVRKQFEADNPVFPQEPDPDPEGGYRDEGRRLGYGDLDEPRDEQEEDEENIDEMIERTERELQAEIKREADAAQQQLYYEYDDDDTQEAGDYTAVLQQQQQPQGQMHRGDEEDTVVIGAGDGGIIDRRQEAHDRRMMAVRQRQNKPEPMYQRDLGPIERHNNPDEISVRQYQRDPGPNERQNDPNEISVHRYQRDPGPSERQNVPDEISVRSGVMVQQRRVSQQINQPRQLIPAHQVYQQEMQQPTSVRVQQHMVVRREEDDMESPKRRSQRDRRSREYGDEFV